MIALPSAGDDAARGPEAAQPKGAEDCATWGCPRPAEPGEDYCSRCRYAREKAQDDAEGR